MTNFWATLWASSGAIVNTIFRYGASIHTASPASAVVPARTSRPRIVTWLGEVDGFDWFTPRSNWLR